jgi:hypothetical protein
MVAGTMLLRRAHAATTRLTTTSSVRTMMRPDGGRFIGYVSTFSFKRRREHVAATSSSLLVPSTITKRAILSWASGDGGGGGSGGVGGINDSSHTSSAAAPANVLKSRIHYTCSGSSVHGAQSFTSGARSILKIPSFKIAKVCYTGKVSFLDMKTVCFTHRVLQISESSAALLSQNIVLVFMSLVTIIYRKNYSKLPISFPGICSH